MKKEKYIVTGMTCSACSARVQKAVDRLPGIREAAVNLLTGTMQVSYDESMLDPDGIIAAVENAGYGASLPGACQAQAKKDSLEGKDALAREDAAMKQRLIWSIVFLLPLMYVAMHHMLLEWFGIPVHPIFKDVLYGPRNAITFAFAQMLLVMPILVLNRKYFINGFRNLLHGSPNMDSLVGMGSAASVVFGVFAIFRMSWGMGHNDMALVTKYSENLYFESAGMIVALITVGKYLEARARKRTGEALKKLMELMPKTALVLRAGQEVEIPARELLPGDEVVVKPGGVIAADGIVISGNTSIDESAITGESIPVVKKPGDQVISATINQNGYIHFRAQKVGEESTISQIVRLVDEAGSSKAPIARIADKAAAFFVPTVIGIAAVAAGIWLAMGKDMEFAFSIAICVLVISCPCALGLATPVAIMTGTGKGAEKGILIKSGVALEEAGHIDTVVLDKTGTITQGRPRVTDVICLSAEEEMLALAASLEKASQHPLAKAILEYAATKDIAMQPVTHFANEAGRGIGGVISGRQIYAGNAQYMETLGIDIDSQRKKIEKLSDMGKTVLFLADEAELLGIFAVADTEKESSYKAVAALKQQGISVVMLTGDNERTAGAMAKRLGITQVVSEVLPQDKERVIYNMQQQGHKVAMVGDGINDAPALARADVGIAIGAGTDVAIESADVVLMGSNLLDVVDTIGLSRAVIQNIKENLFWAFIYNIVGIPLAAGLLYPGFGLKLSPMIASAAMSMSSVCVVLNALRLKRYRFCHGSIASDNEGMEQKIDEVRKDGPVMKTELKIEGMMCKHCQKHVNDALSKMEGVRSVEVNLEAKTATVETGREISREEYRKVIEEAGYELV